MPDAVAPIVIGEIAAVLHEGDLMLPEIGEDLLPGAAQKRAAELSSDGRDGAKPGRAVIQTYTPDNETIRQAARQDYDAFYASELELRRLQNAPPFRDILTLTASGPDERMVLQVCRYAKDRLAALLGPRSDAALLGPTPMAVVRVNNRFRYRVIVNGKNSAPLRAALSQTVCKCNTDRRFRGVSVFADNDPLD